QSLLDVCAGTCHAAFGRLQNLLDLGNLLPIRERSDRLADEAKGDRLAFEDSVAALTEFLHEAPSHLDEIYDRVPGAALEPRIEVPFDAHRMRGHRVKRLLHHSAPEQSEEWERCRPGRHILEQGANELLVKEIPQREPREVVKVANLQGATGARFRVAR